MKRLVFVVVLALALCALASASLNEGTPYPNLNPVFGTLVNFDDVATGNPVIANHYLGVRGGLDLRRKQRTVLFSGSQSPPNYVGTGSGVGWAMDTTITLVNPTVRSVSAWRVQGCDLDCARCQRDGYRELDFRLPEQRLLVFHRRQIRTFVSADRVFVHCDRRSAILWRIGHTGAVVDSDDGGRTGVAGARSLPAFVVRSLQA